MNIVAQQTNQREVSEETQTPPNVQKIREALSLLCDEKSGIVELRAWTRSNGIQSGFYNDLKKLAEDAALLDSSGEAECIAVTMNPVSKELLFRSHNRLHQAGKGETTADENVVRRHVLLIDCDPKRESHTNSTSEEHAMALNKALAVREWLTERGWPVPAIGSSGNGSHLLYRIMLANDDEAKELVRKVLKTINEKFSDDTVEIDTSVSNASRVVRLYGTTNRKGENTKERPQRLSQLFWDETPSQLEVVTALQLRELVPTANNQKAGRKGRHLSAKNSSWAEQNPDLVKIFLTKGKQNDDGIYEMRGSCHGGKGVTALCFNQQNGAGWCNKGCDTATIRRAFGLSDFYKGKKQNGDSDFSQDTKLIKKDELVRLAADAELFCEPDGNGDKAYATVKVGNHFETYLINAKEFRLWLTNEFYVAYEEAVSSQPMQDAINTLAAKAYFEGNKQSVFIRIGELNGKLYYDLGDESWRVVEIDKDGWTILDKSPVKFVRPSGYKSQMIPVKGGNLDELRAFINVSSDDDWTLFIGWLISCFRASGPYAILSLAGTQDAAKSTTTKMIRLLVDPSTALVRAQPKEERDLMVGAKNNWLLAFDNLSHVPEWLSDALCRVTTGGGQASRANYTNGDEYLFDVMRSVVMNGIEELATRPDLADRTINVFLPSLSDEQRKDEKILYAEYMEALPRILGVIFDALSGAIKNLPHTHRDKWPRMADVAKFVTAAEEALGWQRGRFIDAYEEYRHTARINALEASHVGTTLLSLMDTNSRWEGTAADLLAELDKRLPGATSRKHFPNSARGMSGALRRLIPNLKESGIEVEMPEGTRRDANGKVGRKITLTKLFWPGTTTSDVAAEHSLPF